MGSRLLTRPLMGALRRVFRPIGAGLAVLLLVLALVGYVVEAAAVEGHGAKWVHDSSRFVSRSLMWR